MIKIQDYYALVDLMVLDMGEEDDDTPIILERPFLNTTHVRIYVGSRRVHFQFLEEKVLCYFNSYTTYKRPKKNHSRRKRQSQRQRNQSPKNGSEDYKGELVRSEPTPTKVNPQPKHVCKEKVISGESPSQEAQPCGSPSPRPGDAPKE